MTSPSVRVRIARWLGSIPTSIWFIVGAAVILGVSALFGGLDEADLSSRQPPVVPAGEEIVRDELTTIVHSAYVGDVAPGYSFEPEEGNVYLVVEATVTNNARVTTVTFSELIRVDQLEEPVALRTARLVDGSGLPQANPGVPTGVGFVWEVPEGSVSPGDTVRLTITAKSFTADGDVTFGSYWSDPQPTAFVDIEVQ